MNKMVAFGYGVFSYLVFLGTFLYLIGFMGNLGVPKSLDSGSGGSLLFAFFLDTTLILLFSLQHLIMARPWFKRWWTKTVPEPIERSTFVLSASVLLILIFALWQPIPDLVWNIRNPFLQIIPYLVFFLGWGLVLYSSFLIDHFDLFGLRQVWLFLRDRPYTSLSFQESSLYKSVRHPMMLGFLMTLWSTPLMTLGHLLFSTELTVLIFLGIHLEEQDLLRYFGNTYREYRARTSMVIPNRGKVKTNSSS